MSTAGKPRFVVRLQEEADNFPDELVRAGRQADGLIFPFFLGMWIRLTGANR